MSLRFALPALVLAALALPLSAGEPAEKPAPEAAAAPAKPAPAGAADEQLEHKIDKLIKELGSELWAAREEAQQALVAIGEPAEKALEAAAGNKDPEVVQRAAEALRGIRGVGFIGIYINDGPAPEKADDPRGCAVVGHVAGHDDNAKDLQVGDVILAVNGRRIDGTTSLQRAVAATRPNTVVTVKLRREGEIKEIKLKVLPWPEDVPKPETIE